MICRNVYIFSNTSNNASTIELPLADDHLQHRVRAMVWGLEKTSDLLFVLSEPLFQHDLDGYHKAFDINKQMMAYRLDASEAGDTLSVTSDGMPFPVFPTDP